MRARKWVGLVVYVGFLVLCAEIALQLYYRVTAGAFLFTRVAQPLWAPNPHSVFFNKPDLDVDHRTNEFSAHYFTNSRGLRVPRAGLEHEPGRDPERFRILLMGPSFAFGWAVDYEQTFAAQLEQLLQTRGYGGDRSVEIVNAGVNSLGVAQGLGWLKAMGGDYQPDLILQFVYASMAVNTDASGEAIANEEGYLVPKSYPLGMWIREQVKKPALVFYGWVLSTKLQGSSDGVVQGAGRPLEMQANFSPASEEVATSLTFYDDLRATAAALGADLEIVYLPLSYAVHREDLPRWRHLGVTDVDGQVAFDAAYCAYLSQQGVPCIDLTPSLVEAAARGPDRLYYWLDVHWTPLGNAVAARAVADSLAPVRSAEPPSPP